MIVIGAGPAGSAAARKTAQLGLKTLLVEKAKMPRIKLCGGCVTPKVLRLLDFPIPDEIIESSPRAARVHVGGEVFKLYSEKPIVYMTSRERFDTLLATRAKDAGAEVREATLVRNVVTNPTSIEVETKSESLEAKAVIGCDGTGGPTARATRLYQRWGADEISYAIESEVPFDVNAVREFMGKEEYFDLFFGVSPSGYGWIFPKRDHLTVGVGCKLSMLKDGTRLFSEFIQHIPELQGRGIPSPKAHLIPLGGAANVPTVGDRVVLAGDSAGFAEPLLGEGIYFAILAGQVAAEVIAMACRTGKFDSATLRVYRKRCEETFGRDFRAAYQLAKNSYLESYDMDRLAKFFFAKPVFQKSIVGVMEGSMRYRDVQRRLTWLYLKYRLSRIGLPIGA